MSWLVNLILEGFWGIIANIASSFFNSAFKLITDLLLTDTNMNAYVNLKSYLGYFQAAAGGLLTVAVVWEMFKQGSGGMIEAEERSLSSYMFKVVWATFLIFFLPISVEKVFLPLNNGFIKLIQGVGIEVKVSTFQKILTSVDLVNGFMNIGAMMLIMLLVLAIGFVILAISSGIRYVEVVISYLIAPFVAVSAINKGEALSVWVRETTAVVFTQALQIFLLKFMCSVIGKVEGIMMILICIGTIVIAVRGPQVLRTFLYSAGVGSATVSAVGSGGRMAAMKFMMKGAVPAAE